MAPMTLRAPSASSFATARPSGAARRPLLPPARSRMEEKNSPSGKTDNKYHNRNATSKSNPGGAKDAGVIRSDKDEQYAYQQERLEWRRKNQGEGIEDRDEPAHNNQATDMSAERRGPNVQGTSGHGDTLKELVDNITGKSKKDKDGK